MTWIKFLSYLGSGYALYYLCLFLVDSKSAPQKSNGGHLELTFAETVKPEKVTLDDFTLAVSSSVSGSASNGLGGVSLKGLFDLARKDAIEYTKSVSF